MKYVAISKIRKYHSLTDRVAIASKKCNMMFREHVSQLVLGSRLGCTLDSVSSEPQTRGVVTTISSDAARWGVYYKQSGGEILSTCVKIKFEVKILNILLIS